MSDVLILVMNIDRVGMLFQCKTQKVSDVSQDREFIGGNNNIKNPRLLNSKSLCHAAVLFQTKPNQVEDLKYTYLWNSAKATYAGGLSSRNF